MNDAQQRGRRTLILISLMFATPIVIAMYMYFSGSTLNPVTSTEHGSFVTPPRLLPDSPLAEQDPVPQFRKVWTLLVTADAQCDQLCLSALENIRQIRLSLGPKMPRMQTVYAPASATAISADLQTEHPKLIVVNPSDSAEIRDIIGEHENAEVFLVDPLGNLMMRYAPGTAMGDMRKDIAHLLKLSGIG
jgi:hypothetical protein